MERVLFAVFCVFLGLSLAFISTYYFVYHLGLSPEVIRHLQFMAVEKADERGEFDCCIEPGCTMCFMEGNKWNYGEAGTCACDELIARGEAPCPQCERVLDSSCSSEIDKSDSVCNI